MVLRRRPGQRRRWPATPGLAVPLTARLGERPPRQALGHAGGAATLTLPGVPSGWWTLTAELGPDELRADDRRIGVVRVAPVARVAWDSASRHVVAACEVLAANRRIARGDEVTFGRLGRGSSVVQPPDDPAELGALNRALAARGVGWSYGAALASHPAVTDSGPVVGRVRVRRRYLLQSTGSGRTGVLATVGGAPGWCGAATSCFSAAGSTRHGPSCRSRPGSCRSWTCCSTGLRGAR